MAKKEENEIKKQYEKISKKLNLPDYKTLNEEFDIAKIGESETILRDIRKSMMLKMSSALQFVEILLNPSTGNMFHMFLVKGVTSEDKQILDELFDKLGEIEIYSYERDITYNEEKEAEFITEKFKDWKEMQKKLDKLTKRLKESWRKIQFKKSRSYFG